MRKKKKKKIIQKVLFFLSFCLLLVMAGMIFFTEPIRNLWVNDRLFQNDIHRISQKHNVDPQLVRAVIFRESRFDPMARGRAGEIGLMQVMPDMAVVDWAKAHKRAVPSNLELFRPELNIEIGVWFLAKALKRFEGYKYQNELALCQYNAGASRATVWRPELKDGEVLDRITIDSTRKYVEVIMKRYAHYQSETTGL